MSNDKPQEFVRIGRAKYIGEREDKPRASARRCAGDTKPKPWKYDAFEVTLNYQGRTFETPWKQGLGLRIPPMGADKNQHKRPDGLWWTSGGPKAGTPKPPTADDVLSSLLMDASDADQTFEDWCGNLGESTDSRSAMDVYLTCQDIRTRLRKFLGADVSTVLAEGDAEEAARKLCGVAEAVRS